VLIGQLLPVGQVLLVVVQVLLMVQLLLIALLLVQVLLLAVARQGRWSWSALQFPAPVRVARQRQTTERKSGQWGCGR
jgi:hypothetical protein